MKRFALIILLFTLVWAKSQYLFSQNKISQTELLAKWTLIQGNGGDFDKNTLGSTFEYQSSGITLIELMPVDKDHPEDNKGRATWSFDGKVIKLGLLDEDNQVGDTMELIVTNYKSNKLYVTTKREGMRLVFEKPVEH